MRIVTATEHTISRPCLCLSTSRTVLPVGHQSSQLTGASATYESIWGGTSHVGYCPFATGTSGDDFCKLTRHLDTWSDHVDEVSLSHLHACLFSAHRYTTLAMASKLRLGWLYRLIRFVTTFKERSSRRLPSICFAYTIGCQRFLHILLLFCIMLAL
jgi:hypothetical protein